MRVNCASATAGLSLFEARCATRPPVIAVQLAEGASSESGLRL